MGTRGVPAQYGGFETAVEEVGRRLAAAGVRVTVYARNPEQSLRDYLGMEVVNLPTVRRKQVETLVHTGLSTVHAAVVGRPDMAFLFNAANAPFIPVLRAAGIPVAVHVDGLEWQRAKWSRVGRRYYRAAERASVRWANAVVSDARGIADHLMETYGRTSEFIPYGAPVGSHADGRLSELDLVADNYHLVVARFEPENHVLEIVEGYTQSRSQKPLVVVGSSPYADDYTAQIRARAAADSRVRLLGAVWDQELLDELYANCSSYLHGHSVGGTNPSLLRAMGAGAPVIAFDVVFNREVTGGHARFFQDAEGVASCLESAEQRPSDMRQMSAHGKSHVAVTYDWDEVAKQYLQLAERLVHR